MCGIVGILGRGSGGGADWSIRSSGLNIAATIPQASPRWKAIISSAAAPKASSKISKRDCEAEPLAGHTGIGHTRWATHGKPTENNAHPHATENVAVVHNGIIENFPRIARDAGKAGRQILQTETDTEIVLHLVDSYLLQGSFAAVEAVKASLPQLRGAFALAFLFRRHDDLMIGARKGSPLAIGYGDGEMYLGSDAIALARSPTPSAISRTATGWC